MDSELNKQNENQAQEEESKSDGKQHESQQAEKKEDPAESPDPKDLEQNRAITYLSYLGLLFLVPMLAKKESKFAQFHAKQGLVLTIGWIIGAFLMPFFGLGFLVEIFVIILSIMGLLNVNNGKMNDLPIVGDLAKKINL